MRRFIAGAFVLASAGLVAAPSAGAVPISKVTGPVTGTTSYTFVTNGCGFVHQVYDLAPTEAGSRATSITLEGCVTPLGPGPTFGLVGTFTITQQHGKAITGAASGTVANFSPADARYGTAQTSDLNFVLTPGHGARTLSFQGVWCFQGNVPAVNDPVFGALS